MATLKFFASYALFERVILQKKNIFLILPKGEKEDYYKEKFNLLMRFITENYKNKVKFSQQKETLKLVITNDFKSPEELIEFLVKFCKSISEMFKEKTVLH